MMHTNMFPHIQTAGDEHAPAIVFLHGGGLSSKQWQPQISSLAARFYCIAPDLPEQGASADLRPFTLQDAARRVVWLIEELPARKAHVVGLSLGGAVALEVARTAPAVVDHLMVSGTAAGLGKWLGAITIASAGMYRWFSQERLLSMTFKQFNIPQIYQAGLRDDWLKSFNVEFTRHFTEALMQITLPVRAKALVVVGERETVVAKRDARKLAAKIEGARGIVVPKVGHVWNLEAAELFNRVVEAFLTDAPLPADVRSLN